MDNLEQDYVLGPRGVRIPKVQRIRDFDTRWSNFTEAQRDQMLLGHAILRAATQKGLRKEKDLRKEMEKTFPTLTADDAIWGASIERLHSKGYLVRKLE